MTCLLVYRGDFDSKSHLYLDGPLTLTLQGDKAIVEFKYTVSPKLRVECQIYDDRFEGLLENEKFMLRWRERKPDKIIGYYQNIAYFDDGEFDLYLQKQPEGACCNLL